MRAHGPWFRRSGACLAAAVACAGLAATEAGASARSLALGHPRLHSERADSGGVRSSRVPTPAQAAGSELLVTYRSGVGPARRRSVRRRAGVRLVGALPHLTVELVRVARRDRTRTIARLRSQPEVRSVQPDSIDEPDATDCTAGRPCRLPNDPGLTYQWYLHNATDTVQPPGSSTPVHGADVDAPGAWNQTLGAHGVRVAILDSGIDSDHADLLGRVVAAVNFTSSDTTADMDGHGTHVAGIIAATFDNGTGVAGLAPAAELMNVKVMAVDSSGEVTGDCADIADGIVWAADHDADVVNLSLGSTTRCQAITLAVAYAYAHGALVVAAAGNDGTSQRTYPAADPDVLSVGATDNRDEPASFSNWGAAWVDIAAPGVGIASTLPTYANATGATYYGYMSGTSMAAPVVSGIAALIWDEMPAGQVNQEVEARIFATAARTSGTGSHWRYGRVDACLATGSTACAGSTTPTTPTTTPTSTTPVTPPTVTPTTTRPAPTPAPTPTPTPTPAPAPGTPPLEPVARPIENLLPQQPKRTKVGRYRATLPRRAGTLRLTVADGGSALVRVTGTVRLRCAAKRTLRVTLAGLSSTRYVRIDQGRRFRLTGNGNARRIVQSPRPLRSHRLTLTGRFTTSGRATGTLRIRGVARAPARRCDSRPLKWTARLG